jgi:hypothetical protein
VYAEEGLARCEVAVWLGDGEMAVEYGGQTLSRYDVSLSRDAKLEAVTNPRLFANGHGTLQLKLFALDEAVRVTLNTTLTTNQKSHSLPIV